MTGIRKHGAALPTRQWHTRAALPTRPARQWHTEIGAPQASAWRWMLVCSLLLGPACAAFADERVVVVKAARIYSVANAPLDGGMVIIRDGRIEAVGQDLPIPPGAQVHEHSTGVMTPGLIDACSIVDFEMPVAAERGTYGDAAGSFWQQLAYVAAQPSSPEAPAREPDVAGTPPDPAAAPLAAHSPAEHGHVCSPACGGPPLHVTAAPLASATQLGLTWAEQSSEVVPHRLVLDSVNLLARDFQRLMRGGVTTIYVSPDSSSVIGSRGAIVKTAGPLEQRIVRRADAVKASVGSDPYIRGRSNDLPPSYGPPPSFHTRRPTTRMGVDWVFRKAFYDAQRARTGLPLHGADMPPDAALPVLQDVLDGRVPLRIQARMQHDIFTALRLADEFKLTFTLEEATEAYRCLPELRAAGVPVVFGPLYETPRGHRARTDEVRRPRLNTPAQLADAGIEFALTAQELRDEEGLVRQAMMAARNGLAPDAALRAITATPARLLGLAGQVGELSPGAAADLVVWSGAPLAATRRPVMVMIAGRVVGP